VRQRTVEFAGKKFTVDAATPTEENFWTEFSNGRWEQVSLQFMIDHRKGATFVDIGSWIGPVSLLMSQLYRNVVSVDFDPVANKKFRKNLELNNVKNVSLHEIGLSDAEGTLRVNADDLGSSMTSIYGQVNDNSIEVKVQRFDEFMGSLPVADVGFIKIDVEGAEYKFLPQVYRFIRRTGATALVSYHPFVLRKPLYYFTKLKHWLLQLQFNRYYFTSDGRVVFRRRYVPLVRLADNFPMADVLKPGTP
jgi:FkbM family methyltransferase